MACFLCPSTTGWLVWACGPWAYWGHKLTVCWTLLQSNWRGKEYSQFPGPFTPWLFSCAPEHLRLVCLEGPGLAEVRSSLWALNLPVMALNLSCHGTRHLWHLNAFFGIQVLLRFKLLTWRHHSSWGRLNCCFFCAPAQLGLVWTCGSLGWPKPWAHQDDQPAY